MCLRAISAFALALWLASPSPTLAGLSTADEANINAAAPRPAQAALPPGVPADVSPEVAEMMRSLAGQLPPPLSGDEATACEVILCLAGSVGAGGGVSECVPPIRKYLTIKPWKRLNFLRLCPKTSGQGDARMDRLVEIIASAPGADGQGRICSSGAINAVNRRSLGDGEYYIANDMPAICSEYYSHVYTDLAASVPVYIGEPMDGGFWAEQKDSAAAQARYDAERADRRERNGNTQRSAYSTL